MNCSTRKPLSPRFVLPYDRVKALVSCHLRLLHVVRNEKNPNCLSLGQTRLHETRLDATRRKTFVFCWRLVPFLVPFRGFPSSFPDRASTEAGSSCFSGLRLLHATVRLESRPLLQCHMPRRFLLFSFGDGRNRCGGVETLTKKSTRTTTEDPDSGSRRRKRKAAITEGTSCSCDWLSGSFGTIIHSTSKKASGGCHPQSDRGPKHSPELYFPGGFMECQMNYLATRLLIWMFTWR